MGRDPGKSSGSLRKVLVALTCAFALAFAVVLPAKADERAIKSRVAPIYPEIAKRLKISGMVTVRATVDADGKVTDAKTLAGNRMLATAAEEAVRKWKFVTAPAASTVDVDINFSLGQ